MGDVVSSHLDEGRREAITGKAERGVAGGQWRQVSHRLKLHKSYFISMAFKLTQLYETQTQFRYRPVGET